MKQIPHEEIFSAPPWMKIMCYMMSFMIVLMAVGLVMMENKPAEILFVIPVLLLIAVSMLIYARLKLMISDSGIRFMGGLKQHHFTWEDITGIDMQRLGKYKTPTAIIYYSGKKLDLQRGFYLQAQFNRILSLLEMKTSPELFTESYQTIRRQNKQNV